MVHIPLTEHLLDHLTLRSKRLKFQLPYLLIATKRHLKPPTYKTESSIAPLHPGPRNPLVLLFPLKI
jgi:hypothetical protein